MSKAEDVQDNQNESHRLWVNVCLLTAFQGLQSAIRNAASSEPCRTEALLGLLGLGQVGGLLLMIELPARAYADPGSGLLTFRMLGAWMVGVSFYIRYKLRKILVGHKFPARANVNLFLTIAGRPRVSVQELMREKL